MIQIQVPGSKSITQRALMLAALSSRPTRIQNALNCDDSRVLTTILRGMGARITWHGTTVDIEPCELFSESPTTHFDCENAGTAIRFSACLSLLSSHAFTLDGNSRMRERPLGPLALALKDLGVDVSFPVNEGFPPVKLRGPINSPTNRVCIDASLSSQFASGLLLVAPRLKHGLHIFSKGSAVSRPYVDLTIKMLQQFNCAVKAISEDHFFIEYSPPSYDHTFEIEPDWSSAAFILAAAHITGTDVNIPGLKSQSIQGDSVFQHFLPSMKTEQERRFNLTHAPDLIAPLAALAAFSQGTTHIEGAAHTRLKECDRIAVLTKGLRAVGCDVEEFQDGMSISATKNMLRWNSQVLLDANNDHRMAMAFGLLKLGGLPIIIQGKESVSKSFPEFWKIIEKISERKS
jgi:3-phosphoshikimate 1-carboxyvinyltransferase